MITVAPAEEVQVITKKAKWVRVLLCPFWPPGEYFVDNVRLVEYDPKTHGQTDTGR